MTQRAESSPKRLLWRGLPMLMLAWVGCSGQDKEPGLVVDAEGVIVCDNPELRVTEPMASRTTSPSPDNDDLWVWGGGVIVADFDGNGRLDIINTEQTGLTVFAGQADGSYVTKDEAFSSFDLSYAVGGAAADYDGDGDLDLYITRYLGDEHTPDTPEIGKNRLLRNDGDFVFTEVTDQAGVDGCGEHHRTGLVSCFRSTAAAFSDIDRDGDLDLMVANYGWVDETDGIGSEVFGPAEPTFLYYNNGDGTFENRGLDLPNEAHDGYTYAATLIDLNNDMWPDLYIVNDFGSAYPNAVLWNNEGTFRLGDKSEGLSQSMTGMGLGVADLNGDSWPELIVPEWNKWSMLESRPTYDALGDGVNNTGKGLWVDLGKRLETGLTPIENRYQKVGWGSIFGDIDNDGDQDVIAAYGHIDTDNSRWNNPLAQQDPVFINEPDGEGSYHFVEAGPAWDLNDDGVGRGIMLADLNRDGSLDVVKRDLLGPNVIYESNCGSQGWLTIQLRQPGTMNTRAVGAKVDVLFADERKSRVMRAGGMSYASAGPAEVHFGLANAAMVDIEITWPDGRTDYLQDIETRQQLVITRPDADDSK